MTPTTPTIRKTYPVSWDQLHRDARALAWRLLETGQWDRIVAITRGGLVPAAIISRELDIRLVDTVCLRSYHKRQLADMEILKSVAPAGDKCLLIDDLVDTGGTARVVRKMLPEAHFATVYAKPKGRPFVDSYITEVSQDTWILFPWDTESQYVEPIVDSRQP